MTKFRALLVSLAIGRVGLILLAALSIGSTMSVTGAETVTAAGGDPGKIDFNKQIRPVLSDKCFRCHGPDTGERQAELRLDLSDAARAKLPSGAVAIVPHQPTASALIARIESPDTDLVMPPPSLNKPLSENERELLRRWVAEGGDYHQHWAFVPPQRPTLPPVVDSAWSRTPIDRFVLARIEQAGLKPSAEAGSATLIRRVTLDLTGLPPTPEDVAAFEQDREPRPLERVVDRLLASPHYGERLALEWLDAARYADTHGYHIDSHRDMWPWRDWVINAFNQNLPFDRFTIEQLAGDLLPNATQSQRVASGFHRNHMINFEGGAIPAEYLNNYIVDRVNTTSTVWLGMSIGCAQCHDHKYDPFSQRDYYQLYAFFHNVPENGLDGRKGNAAPVLKLPNVDQQRRLDELAGKLQNLRQQLVATHSELDQAQASWESQALASQHVEWTVIEPTKLRSRDDEATLTKLPDHSIRASGANPPIDIYQVQATCNLPKITGIRLEALADDSLPFRGPGRSPNGNVVLTSLRFWHNTPAAAGKDTEVKFNRVSATFSQKDFGTELLLDANARNGWAIYPEVGRDHSAIFTLTTPVDVAGLKNLTFDLGFISEFAQHQLGRFRLSVTSAEQPQSEGSLPAPVHEALAIESAKRTAAQRNVIRDHYRRQVSSVGRRWVEELAQLGKQQQDLEQLVPTSMVMQELPQMRDTHVLVRGQYDKLGDKVTPGVPAGLVPLAADAPLNRLGLAQWLVDRRHPLTARVIVNRYWQMLFGVGLVKTSEDFGSQGEWPSHPELLDWLAQEFVESGWDVKHVLRLMATSAVYRQSSTITTNGLAQDPENRLLTRGPRFRLSAEFIRDNALAASGLLVDRVGGPSVSPYQPDGIWDDLAFGREFTAQKFVQGQGADLHRRSMYTFWKRTVPPVQMSTFDAPDRETCSVRRARTNTPLQALVLMNDTTYIEAARQLAERVSHQGHNMNRDAIGSTATDAACLDRAMQLLVARPLTSREASVLTRLLADQRARYRDDPAAARKLVEIGSAPRTETTDVVELAAWTTVMSVLLNLDETVTKN